MTSYSFSSSLLQSNLEYFAQSPYNTYWMGIKNFLKKWSLFSFTIFLTFFLCFFVSGCSSQKTIINGLDERDANEVIVFLSSKGIDAYKLQTKSEGPGGGSAIVLFDIFVDSDKAIDAMSALNANGLPRKRMQRLLDLFNAGGLVPSEMQEKIRFQSGLAEQIAGTIRKIDGILDADVQLSFPEEDPLNPQIKKGAVTASVFVKHQGVLDDPNSQLITKIRRLVASSVQGLSFENVTVIADKGRFSDSNSQSKMRSGRETDLVRIWTVVVAKESVARFQTIFITIVVLLFIFGSCALWLLWKILPIVREMGSLKYIFSLKPLAALHNANESVLLDGEQTDLDTNEETFTRAKNESKGKKAQENIEP